MTNFFILGKNKNGVSMKKRIILIIIPIIILLFYFKEDIGNYKRIIILDENNQEIAYIINNKYSNKIDISKINSKYISYILEIEDKDFYSHNGVNIMSTTRALYSNLFTDNKNGGSTITQQMIKNVYLNNSKTIKRKANEILLAYKIEKILSKDEILSDYLSSIYFGNNIYGLANASRYYYNKEYYNLSLKEIISFIALWNSPSIYCNDLDKWNEKTNSIINILFNNNKISIDEYNNLLVPIKLNINDKYISSNRLFFIDQVIKEFNTINKPNSKFDIYYVYTDYKKELEQINNKYQFSMLITNKDGYITTSIGNNNYNESSYSICMNSKRDIGSTIKPLLYYEAIRCNMENKIYKSEIISIPYNNEIITIENNNNRYYGNIDLKTAIAVSDNPYAILTHLNLGMNTLSYHLKKYKIEANAYPSLALGSVGISLYDLNRIYTQFFCNGYYITPKYIKSININNKKYLNKINKKALLNKDICLKVKEYLKYPFNPNIKYSTLGYLGSKIDDTMYGKSGSTLYDSYIIGFNEDYLISIWSGNMDGSPISNNHRSINKDLFLDSYNIIYK